MARNSVLLLTCGLALLVCSSFASAAVVEHSFHVQNLTVNRLCRNQVITAVNGSLPGPTLRVNEGDTLVVHVNNNSPYNLTIHWHGVFQLLSGWADGPEFVTQCPIRPGQSYAYRFNITGQEGTLWWHAHVQWLRATVYGALIIRPRPGRSYPFPRPDGEVPIILGEWWNANVIDVENEALATGGAPNQSDAYTINGRPGDLYPCSSNNTFRLNVEQGKTYLLRVINAALNIQLFFKIANHNMTVVAVDAAYTNPYVTDVVVIAPGQTTDVLLTANQASGLYYMAANPYASAPGVSFTNTPTTGIVAYNGSTPSQPIMPVLPVFNDTPTAHRFFTNLTGLISSPFWIPVPRQIDERMFVTIGLGLTACGLPGNTSCAGPFGQRFAASMNNASFQLPTRLSMLEAFFKNVSGIYTTDFPNNPPLIFDYTNTNISLNQTLLTTTISTKVKKVKFNSTVEIVMQNTALLAIENHPIHLHGFNFFVVAQGFGNYNPATDSRNFNLVNPQERNTIAVPVGGWAVIRFRANNPGVWFIHCHLEAHMDWGLATAFVHACEQRLEVNFGTRKASEDIPTELQSRLQGGDAHIGFYASCHSLRHHLRCLTRVIKVQNLTVNRLCRNQVITAVNGSLPGPTLRVNEGDTLVVHVVNNSPYNLAIHWHGIFQLLSGWADGAEFATQCPIRPGQSYTYRFNITGQEGTLWWHAHVQWLRATVHGALIIRPRPGRSYPFPRPDGEVPIILGEWWNANVNDVENEGLATGRAPNQSDAYTINGRPGDLYPCSSNNTFRLNVEQGKTYLLRIINAALNNQLFFKIANHNMTVVAVDAAYTNPYVTDVVVIAPGQTTDVLLTANQASGLYYMAANPYASIPNVSFPNTIMTEIVNTNITTGIIAYNGSTPSQPIMPVVPAFNDTPTAHRFFTNLTGLVSSPFWIPVPRQIDERMFITIGLGLTACGLPGNTSCEGPFEQRSAASMNNASFQLPTRLSMLEAFFRNVSGIYTTDFPNNPPLIFDYTNTNISLNQTLLMTTKSTKVKKVKFNSTIEIVMQNTALLAIENHPIHLHGFNFFVVAQGFGNYNPATDSRNFNLVNPQERNTIAVPVGGWAVIRFRANNPGTFSNEQTYS
ncbi:hypothetical protein BUALT_Bualt11G0125500 [Buddleja alternifolia]|uniref:Laccase n=1 Tax=Buddleja alternifolia TaxID=168488 RepID=A0AAV6WVD2_9LAMI|nr:hypothetical protein BUALT_Bualt11G0125500 [Buddleja alternifolia]